MRNLFAKTMLMTLMVFCAINVNAGLVMSDIVDTEPQPCSESKEEGKTDWGIIVTDIVGIIVTDLTGIIVTDVADTQTNCGIIVTD